MEQQYKIYDSIQDEDEIEIDYKKLGTVELDSKAIMKYFPTNNKGVGFSSRIYNPFGAKPKAPNSRLELNIKDHQRMLGRLDLVEMLKFVGLLKDKKYPGDEQSQVIIKKELTQSEFLAALEEVLAAKISLQSKLRHVSTSDPN